MGGGDGFVIHFVDDGGEKTCMAAIFSEKTVEKGDGGGFAIGAGDTDKLQLPRGVSIETIGHDTQGNVAVFNLHIGHTGSKAFRHLAAHHGGGAFLNSGVNILVSVDMRSLLCHKATAWLDFARVKADAADVGVATHMFLYQRSLTAKECYQFHGFNSNVTVAPRRTGVRGFGDCDTTLPCPEKRVLSPTLCSSRIASRTVMPWQSGTTPEGT